MITPIEGGVTAPAGFVAAGVAAGIKKMPKKDVALIFSREPETTAAAVFTTNGMAAAPIVISKRHVAAAAPKAIVANSGNANACTGPEGTNDAVAMARIAGEALGIDPHEVIVASTGVIGAPLPMDAVELGIKQAAGNLGDVSLRAAEAIMTTDTFPKQYAVEFGLGDKTVRIGGIAKGSGMIQPDMATMLAFVTTDAAVERSYLREALAKAVDSSFNMITVDGETSTNDMVALLASGAAGNEPLNAHAAGAAVFEDALRLVCAELAKMIARDGEGATKFVEVRVTGALNEAEAKRAALAVANSPLVKTALFAQDPNWGRIASAVGASGAMLEPERLSISIGDVKVAVAGAAADFDEADAKAHLEQKDVVIAIDLGVGSATATVWTCDLSYDYVKINAEYRT